MPVRLQNLYLNLPEDLRDHSSYHFTSNDNLQEVTVRFDGPNAGSAPKDWLAETNDCFKELFEGSYRVLNDQVAKLGSYPAHRTTFEILDKNKQIVGESVAAYIDGDWIRFDHLNHDRSVTKAPVYDYRQMAISHHDSTKFSRCDPGFARYSAKHFSFALPAYFIPPSRFLFEDSLGDVCIAVWLCSPGKSEPDMRELCDEISSPALDVTIISTEQTTNSALVWFRRSTNYQPVDEDIGFIKKSYLAGCDRYVVIWATVEPRQANILKSLSSFISWSVIDE